MPANHNICFMRVFSINDSLYDGNGPGHDCQYHGKSKTASRPAQAED
jgi:hypothetical protein